MKSPDPGLPQSPTPPSPTSVNTGNMSAGEQSPISAPIIFDGLVPPAFVQAFHTELNCAAYGYGRVSNSWDEPIKAWGLSICTNYKIQQPNYMRSCVLLFKLIEDRLIAEGLPQAKRFFRIGVDARTEGMSGYIHPDHEQKNMMSVLYYVNSVWKPEWNGQTFFYTDINTNGALCRLHKPATIVDYIPGRFAVFPSQMLHSSTAPTDGATGLRLTLTFVYEF